MKWFRSGILLVALITAAVAAPTQLADEEDPLRLPKSSVPISYDLALTTNVHTSARAFSGTVKIEIEIKDMTNVVTLHNSGLAVVTLRLLDSSGNDLASTYAMEADKDFIRVTSTTRQLAVNERVTLEITFTGNLSTGTSGFYRSSYTINGTTRYLATTQFQSTGARRTFICYDEPGFKATFKLTMTHGSIYSAVSNTEGTTVEIGNGMSTTTFATTPRMSSYLLAFIVSDFQYTTNENGLGEDEVLHRIYARPDAYEKTQYALDHAVKLLKELELYAFYDYQLPKMWSAAIPDFAAGAMENWGLITYKEQYLIGDENSHPREVLDILKIQAHEIGHQFFGNVVTCEWWDQIWLNEGFATLFEYLLVEQVYPEMGIRDYFNVHKVQNALLVDSAETHPMTYDGETNSRIIYDKAGSVIRMFQFAVGEVIFRNSLSGYLITNHHEPVTSDKLYAAFEAVITQHSALGFDFTRAFRNWETTKGFPLVTVKTDAGTNSFRITQERYYAATEERVAGDTRSWYIPLSYATANNPNFDDTTFTDWFPNGEALKTIAFPTGFDESQWYIFNKQQIGVYRVNYDIDNWYRLILLLNSDNFEQIHVLNRAQLVDDALNLAMDGYLDYQTAFSLVSYLRFETNYIPWRAAVTNLDKLDYLFKDQPNYKEFIRILNRKMFATYGTEERPDDNLMDKFARDLSIDWTCRAGGAKCLQDTWKHLKKAVDENLDIPASLEITYICNGLKGLNRRDEFAYFWNKMQNSNDQAERLRILDGLMCSTDTKALKDLLETTLTNGGETYYRAHERTRIFSNVLIRSPVGITAMIEFISEFFDEARSVHSIDSALIAIAKRISVAEDQTKLTELLTQLEGKLSAGTTEAVQKNLNDNKVLKESTRFVGGTTFINRMIEQFNAEENQLRLPRNSLPLGYKISLDVRNLHTGALPYTGEVEIDVNILQPSQFIMIHSKNQVIDDVKVVNKNNMEEVPLLDYHLYPEADTLTIYFMEEIPVSQVLVTIKFTTALLTGSTGFYRTSYNLNGRTRYLGATQFSRLSTRYAFPHYDEPGTGYKVPFELKITHDSSYTATSNMPEHIQVNADGTSTTSFDRSPPISSYIIAFIVSDLQSISNALNKPEADVLQRVWVRPDSITKAQYALDNSINALKALEEYVGFPYELPKVDSAGIPNKSGAMENWGMLTYRENAMIYEEDPDDISHAVKLSGVDVISHELAHQFFGDSVTCEWWDYLWLNEGFATIFEYQITDIMYPDWKTRHFFNIRSLHSAFRNDATDITRAMTTPVLTFAEVNSLFDFVSYAKSGSVIRMFQHAVGENIFRASLKRYLETNNQKGATSQDLVDAFVIEMALASNTAFNFDTAFRTWERQAGFPLVTVGVTSSGQFNVTQQRFFTQKKATATDTSSWYIPLNYATASNANFDDTSITNYFVNGDSSYIFTAPQFDSSQWFVFNKQQLGYYRVNYDAANWQALISVLNSDNFDQIHVLNRVQLVDDSITLAAGGYLDYDTVFSILSYLIRETEYTPFFSAERFISTLYTTFGSTNSQLNAWVRTLTNKFYRAHRVTTKDYSIPAEGVYARYNRDLSFKLACNAGNQLCLQDTYKQVHNFVDNQIKIPNGMESSILCSGLRGTGKQQDWVAMWNRMTASTDATFKSYAIAGLGCSNDAVVLKDYLESTLGAGNSVSYTQAERRNVLSAVLSSSSGLTAVINFFKSFETNIMSSYGYNLENLLSIPARTIKTSEQQAIFNEYLATLTHLDAAAAARIVAIVDSNLQAQVSQENAQFMQFITKMMETNVDENQLRLPKNSAPLGYKLSLDVSNLHTGDLPFTGEVEIDLRVSQASDHIMIHSKNQVILDLKAVNKNGMIEVPVRDHHLFPAADTLTIYFTEELPASTELLVTIKYSTMLLTNSNGFYRTSYTMGGRLRYIGATQFESTNARYTFPHYDEPGYKVPIALEITHTDAYTAIANMPENIRNNGDGTHTTSFEPTPPMSSYLLAFIVSDLEYISNADTKQPQEHLHRIWVRADSLSKAEYALSNSQLVLEELERYTGFSFELPKVDSAGVPNKGGAMENWGMVTYRENAMIYEENPDDISHAVRLSGVDVISHELAHQFFGDSVTCEWWDYIWLNEGFATLFEFQITGEIYPDWNTRHFMNIRSVHSAFRNDGLDSTRAMTSPLLTPAQISNAFDTVVYAKSGSVLRMFQNAVGETIFRASLKRYLETNNQKGATSQDLVDAFVIEMALASNTAFNFDTAFRTWERQAGFPLVTVSVTQTGQFNVTQQRFFTQKKATATDTSSWYIPLNYATASNANFDDTSITNYFVNGDSSYIFTAPQFDSSQWFIFNKQQLGYYRVNYDAANWQALISVLNSDNFNQIHVLNRVQLVDDSITLAAGGYLDYETVFGILTYLVRETEYTPFFSADRFISTLYTTFGPFNVQLNTFVRTLSDKFYQAHRVTTTDYSIPAEGVYARYNRDLSFKLACNAENYQCLFDTYMHVQKFVDNQISIPKGMESVIYCSGLRGAGKTLGLPFKDDWIAMWHRMTGTTDATFKSYALSGLGCSDDLDILKDYLESTLGSSNSVSYTQAERRNVLSAVLNSKSGLEAVINFFKVFELDIMSSFGYSLENLLGVPARTIKNREQQKIFNDYLATLIHLDTAAAARVAAIVESNLQTQLTPQNAEFMAIITRINGPLVEDTTTVSPGTSSTATSGSTGSTGVTGTSSSTPTSTAPSTIPSTSTVSTTVAPTTLGAATIGIKLITLIACVFVAFSLKF